MTDISFEPLIRPMTMEDKSVRRITILGGTGSLGRALLPEAIKKWPNAEITVVSRDEHKQSQMRKQFPQARYSIADIRDRDSIAPFFIGRDIVFHFAALKHVDILEDNPMECIKTNVLATDICASEAVSSGVKHFVFSSTDKAIDPINTYGFSKALSEKILFDYNLKQSATKFSVYRWGNVLGSQGSAIPFFADTLRTQKMAYITHQDMTRFWIPIQSAVSYMLISFQQASLRQAMIPPNMKAAKITEIIRTLAYLLAIPDYKTVEIGIRPGEKLHEDMYSQHSYPMMNSETYPHYSFDELIDLLIPLVGETKLRAIA